MNHLNVSLLLRGDVIETAFTSSVQYKQEIEKVLKTITEFADSIQGTIDGTGDRYKELITLEVLFLSTTPEKVREKLPINERLENLTSKGMPYKLVERGPHTKLFLSMKYDENEVEEFMQNMAILYDLLGCIKTQYKSDRFIGSVYAEVDCNIKTEECSMTDINIKSALTFQAEYVKRMVAQDESNTAQTAMENELTNALNDLLKGVSF